MILCGNPRAQYLAHKAEIDSAIEAVLQNGRYILGQEVRTFEEEFTRYIGADSGIAVGSGTEALHIALSACGVGLQDEVITVSHTAVATVAAIELCGAVPVFVDIDPLYFTLNTHQLESAITEKTKAIIPVHIYGQPAELDPILAIARRHNIVVIEDCAQSHGSMYAGKRTGSWGDIACFSFYPTKNLGAIGDGGMIVTSNSGLADRARQLREYGWKERYVSLTGGWNSRLDEIQAAVLRVKLKYLDADNTRRRELAKLYEDGLSDLSWITLPAVRPESAHVFHLYVIRCQQRDRLQKYLEENGVGALVHYPVPIHLQPAYHGRLKQPCPLAETEQAAQKILSLPMYPELSDVDVQSVVETIRAFQQ